MVNLVHFCMTYIFNLFHILNQNDNNDNNNACAKYTFCFVDNDAGSKYDFRKDSIH